jgi:hypothetical protein
MTNFFQISAPPIIFIGVIYLFGAMGLLASGVGLAAIIGIGALCLWWMSK